MMKFFLCLCILLSGCAQFGQMRNAEEELQKRKAIEEREILGAETSLAQGRFEEAQAEFQKFQTKNPGSVFFEAARIGEGQSLEGLGRPQEAAALYRDVLLKTDTNQPEIAALALYRMSFAYEALGDDVKMVAALLDAKKRGEYLPKEIREAQIPARLAAAYARKDREPEAVAYINEAEKGIARVLAEKGKSLKSGWLAKMYYEMGSISTHQLSVDNFEDFIRGQKAVQAYLLKALKQNDSEWSARSRNHLQKTYQDLYIQFESLGGDHARQIQLGGAFVELMDQADLFKPLSDQKMNSYESDFFSYLNEVRKKTEGILYGPKELLSLTEESQRLNSLRRPGRVKVETLLPEEEKSNITLPPKVVPSEDPNL